MSESNTKGKSALEIFPGLVQDKPDAKQANTAPPKEHSASSELKSVGPLPTNSRPVPPPPPDISWLKSGKLREKAKISDIPIVLVLVKDEKIKTLISEAMQEFDYQVEYAKSAEEVIERTKHLTPAFIINHLDIADGPIEESTFHEYVSGLPMSKRRGIVYILIAAQLRTLYNLHALSYSANIVVNDKDVQHLGVIIRKGLHDYVNLFGSFAEAIQRHGT